MNRIMFKGNNFTVVKKVGKAHDLINKYKHPEANIVFMVVKGKVNAFINEKENYLTIITVDEFKRFSKPATLHKLQTQAIF